MKGVTLRYEPQRPRSPWGVWVEVIIGGKPLPRTRKGYATEADARIAYAAICDEIEILRAATEEDARRRKALAVPELPTAPKGSTLFETLAYRWLAEHVKPMRTATIPRGTRESSSNTCYRSCEPGPSPMK